MAGSNPEGVWPEHLQEEQLEVIPMLPKAGSLEGDLGSALPPWPLCSVLELNET